MRPVVLIGTHLPDIIETDQVAIDIGKDITREKSVLAKHRPGTTKAWALPRAMPFNIIKQGILAPAHFKSAIFFMLTN